MERQEMLTRAAVWMQARGWRQKLAKRQPHEQSLFEHSLVELDVLLELLPILESLLRCHFTPDTQKRRRREALKRVTCMRAVGRSGSIVVWLEAGALADAGQRERRLFDHMELA